MKKFTSALLGIAVFIIVMLGVRYAVGEMAGSETTGLTKSGYLKQVEKNYEYSEALSLGETKCAYSYLIDRYGVKETLKMDTRVAADESDVDPRLFEAINECS